MESARSLSSSRKTASRMLIAGAIVAAFATGVAAGGRWRSHPSRLDLANDHLASARGLVIASEDQLPVEFSGKGHKQYDKYLDQAIKAIDGALDAINSMIGAAEGG